MRGRGRGQANDGEYALLVFGRVVRMGIVPRSEFGCFSRLGLFGVLSVSSVQLPTQTTMINDDDDDWFCSWAPYCELLSFA